MSPTLLTWNHNVVIQTIDSWLTCWLLYKGVGETDLLAADPDLLRGKLSGETERFPDLHENIILIRAASILKTLMLCISIKPSTSCTVIYQNIHIEY